MPEALPEDLAAALERTAARRGAFGALVQYHTEIGSTNDAAARLAEAGAAEGTTVIAGAQSAGRGRFGRTWFSPPGAGLYASVIVRDRRAAPLLTLAGGVAAAEGIRAATGLNVRIKWPNDIVVEHGRTRRKLAGILAEASSGAEGLQYVVLGFGINLRPAAYPVELADSATALETELGRQVDGGFVAAECLAALAAQVSDLAAGASASLLARWQSFAPSAVGSPVEWETSEGIRSGRTAGIDSSGALLVRRGPDVERIVSGTVRWL